MEDKKVVLVTGASRGIGSSIAKYLSNDYTIIGNYNKSKDAIYKLKDECAIDVFKADVSDKYEVLDMINYIIKKYGKIDVLVNNAGIDLEKTLEDTSDDDYERVFNTNFYSVFNLTREVSKYMIKSKSGCIINISSIDGVNGASNASIYSASKGAVNAFTKALSKELGPSNIRVNAIAPGCIDTDMNSYLSDDEWNYLINKTSLGRKGKGLDIAKGVKFLIEDDFITGQVITIDGGFEN